MKTEEKELDQGAALNTGVISAGKKRLAWVRTNWPIAAHTKSSRIVMDFDEQGELMTYWETLFDAAGKELIGGGISRDEVPSMGGTKTCRGVRFSPLQIQALIAGVDHKFARSCLGWWSDDGLSFFRPATIKSLHKRGSSTATSRIRASLMATPAVCRPLMGRGMNIHRRCPNSKCGRTLLARKFSTRWALSVIDD